jgi:precorrin-2 dehydrogenase/sirohydrochlorin ferrochelatase
MSTPEFADDIQLQPTYPIELRIAGRPVVVVGGGPVAARKVKGLLQADAHVTVVARVFADELIDCSDITRVEGEYRDDLLEGAILVFACTDDVSVNRQVAEDAHKRGIWCNVADDPERSDFFVPSILRRGAFSVAIGTAGASPSLAAELRRRLESQIPGELGILVEEMARARSIVRQQVADEAVRRSILQTLCGDCSLKLLAKRDRQAWRDWFERIMTHRLDRREAEAAAEQASAEADHEPTE